MMKSISSLLALILLSAISLQAEHPNVIVIMTDDQGYGDISAHGNPYIETPNIDALRSESVRLENFHVAPMCTPTRSQFLTGLDAVVNGAVNVSSGKTLIDPELNTLADAFQAGGYRTGLFGKWHLGDTFPYRPQDRGFQRTLWFPSSHINSVPDVWNNDYFDDTYRNDGALQAYKGYCTDVFFEEAMKWIGSRDEEPFFLFLPTNAPHWPLWVPEENRLRVEKRSQEQGLKVEGMNPKKVEDLIKFLGMIENIDDNLGRLESFLAKNGLKENTILVYLTDNGSTYGHSYFPANMRGKKTERWDGGHRVPCFIRYPEGGLEDGKPVEGATQVQDLPVTLLSLAGVSGLSNTHGIDLAPVLRGEDEIDENRSFVINYSRMPHGQTYPFPNSPSLVTKEGAIVVQGDWRYFGTGELYDLSSDPLQEHDIASDSPEKAKELEEKLTAWWSRSADKANQVYPVTIGSPQEPEVLLTACEWVDVFIDQQLQVRRGDLKNSWWELDVAEPGVYSFELRRWPRESGLALSDTAPEEPIANGNELREGRSIVITNAAVAFDGEYRMVKLKPDQKSVVFEQKLGTGPVRFQTWFGSSRVEMPLGAYYVYVERKDSK